MNTYESQINKWSYWRRWRTKELTYVTSENSIPSKNSITKDENGMMPSKSVFHRNTNNSVTASINLTE